MEGHEFHWLIGILEGEGTFGAASPSAPGIPVVRVVMTDRDVVDRVGALWGRAVFPLAPRQPHHKVPYVTALKGAAAVVLMKKVREHMSASRQRQIDRAVRTWRGHRARKGMAAPVNDLVHDSCNETCAIAWLAGLLEGEGTFSTTRADGHTYPLLQLNMCGGDVVRRAGTMLGAASVRLLEPRHPHWSSTYVTKVSGTSAAEWMGILRPLMGVRRREAIDRALVEYRPIQLAVAPAQCVVEACVRPHRGRGLCHRHYMSWSRDFANGRTPRITPLR